MHLLKQFTFIPVALVLLACTSSYGQKDPPAALKLWYQQPAVKWTDALPIGNGRLGAMVFAGVEEDRIQFNEETLWTGEPRNHDHPGAASHLAEIRRLLAQGQQDQAEKLAQDAFMGLQSQEGSKEAWVQQVRAQKEMNGNPALPAYDDSNWKTIAVPAYEGWETVGLEGLDGAVWFRTTFELPAAWRGQDLVLDLNRIRDHDFSYVNGRQVGTTEGTGSRRYTIPQAALQPGKNTLAIQVLNYFDKGGIAGYKDTSRHIAVYPKGMSASQGLSLVKNWKYFIQDDEPPAVPRFQADYQPFGDLRLTFSGHHHPQNYRRELNLNQALSQTSYTVGSVHYTREYFVSQPHQAIVVRLTASRPGSISFETQLSSPHKKSAVRRLDDQTLALSVQVRHGALRGESLLRVVPTKGQATVAGDKIVVAGADAVTLYLTAGTNYRNYQDVSADPAAPCRSALASLAGKKYKQVRQAHIREYQQYFNTLSIDLGRSANENLPTDQRIEKFATDDDPAMAALYLQYGRYLLIAASRPGTRPANLQGIWNDLLTPPWGSKYTTNINAQMNYWPAEALNLSPMHEPLFQMIAELAGNGRQTAKVHYNAPGWVLHHNTDLWRATAPINASNHGIWVTGGAWLSQHLWERYLYTQDLPFLREHAYPLMKEAARFFNAFLVEDPKTGWLISTPSNSPEQGGLVAGPTMDHQLIRTLFRNTIQASALLHLDPALRDSLQAKYSRIAPNQIGRHGQLQEWLEDVDDPENKHRHVSHLWGVHPGSEINWDHTPDLMKAARQSLLYRGDAGTGWSLAWKINFWARFKEGDHAYKMIKMLIHPAAKGGGSYVNLFDAHPPFQIDGNFGGAAGIGEMLVQSHTGPIDLLPALPAAWPAGEVKGICARGGFELHLKWRQGKLQEAEILSKAGQPCTLRYGGKTIRFDTKKGKTYKVNQDLKKI